MATAWWKPWSNKGDITDYKNWIPSVKCQYCGYVFQDEELQDEEFVDKECPNCASKGCIDKLWLEKIMPHTETVNSNSFRELRQALSEELSGIARGSGEISLNDVSGDFTLEWDGIR